MRGATWQVGWQVKGPRVSGPWLGVWGGNANALPRPKSYTRVVLFFYSVWDYVPTETYICRTRGSIGAVGSKRKVSIAWTRVHAIFITTRALKLGLSEMDRRLIWRHVDTQGEPDPHQTVAIGRHFGNHETPHGRFRSVRSPLDGRRQQMTWSYLKQMAKNGRQRLKLNHDRGPIAPRSGLIHRQIGADLSWD